MTIWNMLIVVCNRSTESQLMWSRTDNDFLKTFDFIPYAILIKSTTQIMALLFVSVGSRLLKIVTNYDNQWLQITHGEREVGVKLHSIVTQSSQSSTTTVWYYRCENWETAVRLNHLILWYRDRKICFNT